jgi:outer membrane protein TolC
MRAEMETRRGLAQRMYLPMPMVSGFYEQRTGGMPDSVGGIVGFTVPLWWFDRQRNEVRMAEAMVRRTQRELEAMEVMTRTDLRMAWSRARAAELTLKALEDTALPRIRETVAASESAYASGSADFLALLEATMARQRLEAERLRAVVRREAARYELERLLGASVAPEEKR